MNDKTDKKKNTRDEILRKLRAVDPVVEMEVRQMKNKIKRYDKDKMKITPR